MKVGIIGGGWAGMAAAVVLHDAGHHVEIHEASHTLGGRARAVSQANFPALLDNGQHILLGAYRDTLEMMRRLGQDPEALFLRLPLTLKSATKNFELRCRHLPAPWHAAAGVLLARGWCWSDRVKLTLTMLGLKQRGWSVKPDRSMTAWLSQKKQSPALIRQFWEPLCLAALNTPLHEASADLLARVLGDSLDAGRHASDVLIPKTDLADLWATHLPEDIRIRLGSTVRKLSIAGNGYVLDDGLHYDALVIAAAPASTHRLLSMLPARPGYAALLDALNTFSAIPIATVSLAFKAPWLQLSEAMLMLDDRENPGALGQWVFNHAYIAPTRGRENLMTIVISDCRALMQIDRETAIRRIVAHLRSQTAGYGSMPEVVAQTLIIEKRATFAAKPGLIRPGNRTPWPNLVVAGDWTDTGYPAVLEGAVRSGQSAARVLIKQ